MRAHAHLAVTAEPDRGTRIDRLHSEAPLVLRPTLNTDHAMPGWVGPGAAHVSLAAAAASPIGGDQLRLDVDVGAQAILVVRTVAATLALPGPHAQTSRSENTIRIGRGATLVWLPEPVIATERCEHHSLTRIHLADDARLIAREELILGRHGEQPGALRQRLRVERGGHPLHDQELRLEHGQPGWAGPAVTGGRKALGNLVLVDPSHPVPRPTETAEAAEATVAVQPLDESSTLVTALSWDAHTLRQTLDRHLHATSDPTCAAGGPPQRHSAAKVPARPAAAPATSATGSA